MVDSYSFFICDEDINKPRQTTTSSIHSDALHYPQPPKSAKADAVRKTHQKKRHTPTKHHTTPTTPHHIINTISPPTCWNMVNASCFSSDSGSFSIGYLYLTSRCTGKNISALIELLAEDLLCSSFQLWNISIRSFWL